MTYVLILLVWVLVALLVSMAFGAICQAGSDAWEDPFPASQDPQRSVEDAHGFSK